MFEISVYQGNNKYSICYFCINVIYPANCMINLVAT